jgi:hypothetical protein
MDGVQRGFSRSAGFNSGGQSRASQREFTRIYKRFPDMPLKKVKSPYEKHFTSLDLGG